MSKIDDLEKVQELKNKGVLTQEEFEIEKNRILGNNIQNNDISAEIKKAQELKNKEILRRNQFEVEKQKIQNIPGNTSFNGQAVYENFATQNVNNKQPIKNKSYIKVILVIFIVIILVGTITFFVIKNNNKIEDIKNSDSYNVNDSNINNANAYNEYVNLYSEMDNQVVIDNSLIIEQKLKYNNESNGYILFENNQFEICTYEKNTAVYMRGNYLQNIDEITFKVKRIIANFEYNGQKTITEEEIEQTIIGTLSNNGKTITLLSEDKSGFVYELSDQAGKIEEIIIPKHTEDAQKMPNYEYIDSSNNKNEDKTNVNINVDNEKTKKEMIKVPYFSLGKKLEYYTNELDSLGIAYNVVKEENFDYEDNTVTKIEHNGENIEKGTIITITVADNIYNMNVMVNTGYLLELADLGYDYETVNISIKINDSSVCNGKFDRTDTKTSYPIHVGNYKGKSDNLKLDITIEGIKITKTINYRFLESMYMSEPCIFIYKGGDIGPIG